VKPFSLIINFYILLLPLFPCADTEECDEKAKMELVSTTEHTQHQDEEEACTPFCFCACCPASVFTETGLPCFASPSGILLAGDKYISSFYSFDFSVIWQPPKIG
jgi:hypothetical protein